MQQPGSQQVVVLVLSRYRNLVADAPTGLSTDAAATFSTANVQSGYAAADVESVGRLFDGWRYE